MTAKKFLLAGAAPDTGNLGVSALCRATVSNLLSINPDVDIYIMGHGKGIQKGVYDAGDGHRCSIIGAKHSNRFYDASTFHNIRFSTKLGPFANPTAKVFKEASALLDISGGDSFTDLYEKKRFDAIVLPKLIALENNIPLVLLPQTYGPFEGHDFRAKAIEIVKRSSLAYARDKYSFEVLKEMLGPDFDESKHQQAVDVAFLLPTHGDDILNRKGILPEMPADGREIVGLNVSGLIFNQPERTKSQYGISLDYPKVMKTLVEEILKESDSDIWLVPHVLAPKGHYESDSLACEKLRDMLPAAQQSRVKLITGDYDQCDIKGVISKCDWFSGTRMHSTIASLSNMVPTGAVAYSGKFKGVFESAGQAEMAIDARTETTDSMIAKLLDSWRRRAELKAQLERDIPAVKQRTVKQFQDIAEKTGILRK